MTVPNSIIHARVIRGSGGGPDKTIINSVRYLQESRFDVTCLYLRHPQDQEFLKLAGRARERQVELVPVDDLGAFDFRVPARVAELCRMRTPYIWHGHDYKTNLLGLVARRPKPSCLVTTVHGWVHRTLRTPLYYAIDRLCLPRYDAVLCVSQDLVQECLRAGVAGDRLHFVPNAVDTEEFRRQQPLESAKLLHRVPEGRQVVGAVGRLSKEKGFDLLIRAVADLVERGHDCELWIIGEGTERAELERLRSDLAVADRVRLLGYRSDVKTLYEAFDILALSSLREGLPNVILEGLSMGLPILATRVAGIPLVVRDLDTGLLVEPGSQPELTRGLDRLLSDRELSSRLGRNARSLAVAELGFDARMRKVLEIYEQVCPSQTGRPSSG